MRCSGGARASAAHPAATAVELDAAYARDLENSEHCCKIRTYSRIAVTSVNACTHIGPATEIQGSGRMRGPRIMYSRKEEEIAFVHV